MTTISSKQRKVLLYVGTLAFLVGVQLWFDATYTSSVKSNLVSSLSDEAMAIAPDFSAQRLLVSSKGAQTNN